MGSRKAQGATEYLLILGVLMLIVIVAASLLGYLPGVTGDAKKETYIAQLRAGEPFSIEEHTSEGGRLSLSFANKKSNELELTHIVLSDGETDYVQSTGGLSEFSGGMRRVLTVDVPCVQGKREYDILLVYFEDGMRKEEKLDGKVIVEGCVEGEEAAPGEGCSVDEDCAQGTCIAGICEISSGACSTDAQCESGNCNPYTHFCDPRPQGTCSPRCMLEDASIVCGETIAGEECSGWEDENPQCSVLPNCGGEYSECSLLCGGVCAGWLEECGGSAPCCSGFECSNGFCVQEEDETPACGGTYAACNATTCCTSNYCNQTVGGACQACLTSGQCNATTVGNCCDGYACSTGYSAMDVPRSGTWCGLPDGSECSLGSQCVNGTCYDGACKNCNTNNVCDIANGNEDCCYGKLCLKYNQTGTYTCQSPINVSGSYEYLYDPTWNMSLNPTVIRKVYPNGTSIEARVFGQKQGAVCAGNEECLSNSCVGNICVAQTAGSWCSCSGSGYTTCDSSSACPSGLVCNPYNYTCVSLLDAPAARYGYLCTNVSSSYDERCYQQCYNDASNFYTYCNQMYYVCKKGLQPCTMDAQCCSNQCYAGICAAQSGGSWCQLTTYSPDWPFGNSSTVINPCTSLMCYWNTSATPFCQ